MIVKGENLQVQFQDHKGEYKTLELETDIKTKEDFKNSILLRIADLEQPRLNNTAFYKCPITVQIILLSIEQRRRDNINILRRFL